MIVWICQVGETPAVDRAELSQMRTSLLVAELLKRGHQVVWWASAFDHQKKRWRTREEIVRDVPNLSVIYLRGCGYSKNVSFKRLLDHRLMAWKFWWMSRQMAQPNVILASLPTYDLAYRARCYAKKKRVPFVVDVRDQWPELFVRYSPAWLRSVLRCALYFDFRMFNESVLSSVSLVASMNALLDWACTSSGRVRRRLDRVFYLGARRVPPTEQSSEALTQAVPKVLTVGYIGTFGVHADPRPLAHAIRALRGQPVSFVIGGRGPLLEEFQKIVGPNSNVTYLGWLNQHEMTKAIRNFDLGVCPTTDEAIAFPNKAFQYFAEGVPVLASAEGDLRTLIKDRGLGTVVSPRSDALVDAIFNYVRDPRLIRVQSENVQQAFSELFDAEKIYAGFAHHLETVAASSTQSRS